MPTTSPAMFTNGPPELPGLAAASNWMSPRITWSLLTGNSRPSPETTPAETEGPIPKGNPTATTSSPGCKSPEPASTAGTRSSGIFWGLMMARSFSGRTPTTTAGDVVPSMKVTSSRLDPDTTCKLVMMVPSSFTTTPVPTPLSASSLSLSLSFPFGTSR